MRRRLSLGPGRIQISSSIRAVRCGADTGQAPLAGLITGAEYGSELADLGLGQRRRVGQGLCQPFIASRLAGLLAEFSELGGSLLLRGALAIRLLSHVSGHMGGITRGSGGRVRPAGDLACLGLRDVSPGRPAAGELGYSRIESVDEWLDEHEAEHEGLTPMQEEFRKALEEKERGAPGD